MSNKIEEKVVSMKFDNAQFEKGASTTISTLESLQKSLKLDGAVNGLKGLSDAAKNISLDRLGTSVDNLRGKFEGMGAVATGILIGIGTKAADLAVSMAQKFGNSLISGAKEGFGEYETQINAIQTIMSNTSTKGTTMDQVNGALKELNGYADKTIYNFSEMTRNIGTFTAAGVDLNTSVAAIKGIANLAAVSGSNSQQASTAMYQLSQAMASGTVKLMDWNSVVNAGMGGQVFQDQLKATARAQGIAVDEMIAKNGSFRDSLQEGWLTSSVLTETLAKFTGDLSREQLLSQGYTEAQADEIMKLGDMANDAATKIKTFSQLIGTLKEAVGSGWAESWQIILGDFEEAKALFTEISDRVGAIIQESADARNEQLQIWKDMGGREALIQAMRNAFDGLVAIVEPIRNAFREVFPPTLGKNMAAVSFFLRDLTEAFKMGEQGSQNLYNIFKFVFTGLKFIVDIVAGAFRIFFDNIAIGIQIISGLAGIITPVITFLANLAGGGAEASTSVQDLVTWFITLRREALEPVIEFLKLAAIAVNEFLNGDPSRFSTLWSQAMEPLIELADMFKQRWTAATEFLGTTFAPVGQTMADNWQRVKDAVMAVWNFVKPLGPLIADVFGNIKDGISQMFAGADWDTVLASINTGLLIGIVLAIRKAFKSFTSIFDAVGDLSKSITGALEGLTGVLAGMQAKLKADALVKIAVAIAILAGGLLILSMIDPDRLISAVAGMGSAVGILLGAMAIMSTIPADDIFKVSAAMLLLSTSMNILANAVMKLGGMDWVSLGKGLGSLVVMLGLLLIAAKQMSKNGADVAKAAFGMILMATAINMLAGAVAIFGLLPVGVLVQGMVAVTAILTVLTIAARVLSKEAKNMALASVGMMAMAAALNMLLIPIVALGFLPFENLAQGMLAVTAIMAVLVISAKQLGDMGPKMAVAAVGMLAMSAAINMLVGAVVILGAIPFPMLLQGLAALAGVMLLMQKTMSGMSKSMTGAGSLIVAALAIGILAVSLKILSTIPAEAMWVALLGLAGALIALGVAVAVLTPVLPSLLTLTGAFAIFAVGVLVLAAAFVVFTTGLAALGPALVSATGGLVAFASQAGTIAGAILPMIGIGLAMIVFGAGAAVAGVGILILGAALVVLGAGLALVGAVGLIGATALTVVTKALVKLVEYIPQMILLGLGFGVLGAGVLILGIGLLTLGVAALLAGVGLTLMVASGSAAVPILIALFAVLIEQIPLVAAAIGEGIVAMATVIGENAPVFLEAAKQLIISFLQAVQETTPHIVDTILVLLQEILRMIVAAVPMIASAGLQLIIGLLNAIASKIGDVIAAASNLIVEFLNGISAKLGDIIDAGVKLVISFINGITDGINNNRDKFIKAGSKLFRAVVDGISEAISQGGKDIRYAGERIGNALLEGAASALGINSPSKEFKYRIMGSVGEGIDDGTGKQVDVAQKSGAKIGKSMVAATSKALDNLHFALTDGMDTNPTITPVMDLTRIRQDVNSVNGLINKAPTLNVARSIASASSVSTERARTEGGGDDSNGDDGSGGTSYSYTQILQSPKALSRIEIYRQGQNLIHSKPPKGQ